MREIKTQLAVIGGGPAGLAAAIEAKKQGIQDVVLIERDIKLGGVLQQCIHDGFGLHRFGQRMAGTMYAQKFIDMLEQTDVQVFTDTMVLDLSNERELYACNKEGMIHIAADAVILAMGCRERSASQALIYGYRPSGVLTAGSVQRYINMQGFLPGKKAVILGSGDIGLIMARRMTLEGISVEGVYEVMPTPGGLTRNTVQCLNDYNIPLNLATTVTRIHGKKHIEGVTVTELDENRQPIASTSRYIPCDLLVLAVGLIPENELSKKADIAIDPKTRGPILDSRFMTSVPGIFAAGNVAAVFDLVDYVSLSGEIAARGAAAFIRGEIPADEAKKDLAISGNINFAIPQKLICSDTAVEQTFFLRVKQVQKKATLLVSNGSEEKKKAILVAAPPEMVTWSGTIAAPDGITLKVE